MGEEKLAEFQRDILLKAKAELQETGSVTNTAYLVFPNKIGCFPIDYSDSQEKEVIKAALRDICKKTQPDAGVLVADSWLSVCPNGNIGNTLPSEDPNRQQAIVVTCTSEQGTSMMMAKYQKTEAGKITFEELLEYPPNINTFDDFFGHFFSKSSSTLH